MHNTVNISESSINIELDTALWCVVAPEVEIATWAELQLDWLNAVKNGNVSVESLNVKLNCPWNETAWMGTGRGK
jgi:hypothetical protein